MKRMPALGLLVLLLAVSVPALGQSPSWIAVNDAGSGFVHSKDRTPFIPWGFNYVRDERFRLLEDYWNGSGPDGWPKLERDFREMKRLGANIVRLQLQFAKFMGAGIAESDYYTSLLVY
jgi:hypothetical protein